MEFLVQQSDIKKPKAPWRRSKAPNGPARVGTPSTLTKQSNCAQGMSSLPLPLRDFPSKIIKHLDTAHPTWEGFSTFAVGLSAWSQGGDYPVNQFVRTIWLLVNKRAKFFWLKRAYYTDMKKFIQNHFDFSDFDGAFGVFLC